VHIFSIKGTKLAEITEQEFPLELFDLEYVKSEFELHGLRIDTLAFDKESKGFVIIEYKRDKNLSSRSRNGLPQPHAQ
jgi:RecB family endonuclease NucS